MDILGEPSKYKDTAEVLIARVLRHVCSGFEVRKSEISTKARIF